jgi:hypothetical protein
VDGRPGRKPDTDFGRDCTACPDGTADNAPRYGRGGRRFESCSGYVKTEFNKRTPAEREADAKRMQSVVLRPGFDIQAYWRNLRKDLSVYEKSNKQ